MGMWDSLGRLGLGARNMFASPAALRREWALLSSDECADYYTFLGDDVLEKQNTSFSEQKPLWLNMGYWKDARTYPDACAALAIKLAEAARFAPGLTIMDAGFGYAEQDLLWVERFDLARIIGINITPLHVETARRRVEDRGLSDRIDLRLASATETGLPDESVDCVVALESAFHFNSREDFFVEAMRVLRPGGHLATADMLPLPGSSKTNFVQRLGLRRWGLPPVNVYDRETYRDKLMTHGFVDVEIEPIRDYVYPGINRYAERRVRGEAMSDIQIALSEEDVTRCYGIETWRRNTGIDDYVVFSARKPVQAYDAQ